MFSAGDRVKFKTNPHFEAGKNDVGTVTYLDDFVMTVKWDKTRNEIRCYPEELSLVYDQTSDTDVGETANNMAELAYYREESVSVLWGGAWIVAESGENTKEIEIKLETPTDKAVAEAGL